MRHLIATVITPLVGVAAVFGLPGCVDAAEPSAAVVAAPASRVFDFATRPLAELDAGGTGPTASPKTYLRRLLARAAPRLEACASSIPHRAGSLDITLEIAVERDGPGVVERAVVEMAPSPELAGCMRTTLAALAVPPAGETGTWVAHQTITFGAQR